MRLAAALLAVLFTATTALAEGRITVIGTGQVMAEPDKATIMVGVTTEGPVAAEAMAENSRAMAAVMERLRALGVADRDMQTASLSLSPRWMPPRPMDGDAPVPSGFVASNMLSVEVRDLEALGGILDAALSDGANTLGGLTFGIEDDSALKEAARRAAVADAMAKARVLADAAGLALGDIEEISEGSDFGGPFPQARMDMAMSESVPVAPGELSLNATITLVYAIAD
jgi:uncharacterized protein